MGRFTAPEDSRDEGKILTAEATDDRGDCLAFDVEADADPVDMEAVDGVTVMFPASGGTSFCVPLCSCVP
jgi:hypothetical protein